MRSVSRCGSSATAGGEPREAGFLAVHPTGCETFYARHHAPRRKSPETAMGEGKNLVGVDIGSASIKVCQVKDTKKGIGLLRFGYAPLAPSVIVDGQVMDA